MFGSFLLAGQRVIAEFGIGLASAVFLDAFILRTVLVPAVMHLHRRPQLVAAARPGPRAAAPRGRGRRARAPEGVTAADPYRTLGVDPSVSDEALHDAYRRLVKLEHPDRHGGSAEATRRFQAIQAAYEQATARRKAAAGVPRPAAEDPRVEERLAGLERELREARAARERAAQAARDALREVHGDEIPLPAQDEEDSFSRLLADAAGELRDRVAETRENPAVKRAAEMIAGLDWLASSLGRDERDRDRDGS